MNYRAHANAGTIENPVYQAMSHTAYGGGEFGRGETLQEAVDNLIKAMKTARTGLRDCHAINAVNLETGDLVFKVDKPKFWREIHAYVSDVELGVKCGAKECGHA